MTTLKPSQNLTLTPMELPLMSSAVDFPAKTLARPEKALDLQANDLDFGTNFTESSGKSNQNMHLLKMLQPFDLKDWTKFSGGLLRSGTMRNGIVYPRQPLAPLTDETAFGLLPTPTTQANQLAPSMQKHAGCRLLSRMAGGVGGKVSPMMYEWQMGFPMGWTDLKPSEMPLSRRSRKSLAKR